MLQKGTRAMSPARAWAKRDSWDTSKEWVCGWEAGAGKFSANREKEASG